MAVCLRGKISQTLQYFIMIKPNSPKNIHRQEKMKIFIAFYNENVVLNTEKRLFSNIKIENLKINK